MRSDIKTPALEDLYTQRHIYEQHRKKLGQIRAQRKSHLGFDNNRVQHFQNIKQSKNKTFIHKFNKTNDNIARQNLQFLGKLQSVKPSLRHSVSEERERSSFSYITPFLKKRMMETEKENVRISNKMKNMSSSLNQKHFVKDFTKSQQIKNRIMKYAADESRVYLKSERYLDDNKSVTSKTSNHNITEAKQRRSVASHYKKEDIMKNRIEGDLTKKNKRKFRPNTSLDANNQEEQGSFFTTQPKKQKVTRRKIYL